MRKLAMLRCFWALAAILVAAQIPARGQDNKDEIIQKLLSRVEALEREVAALKQGRTEGPGDALSPAPVEAPLKQDATVAAPEPEQSGADRFTFHGYADIGFLRNQDGASDKRFALGEVDLFASERILPKLNFLVEAVLETDNQIATASVPVNVERLLLQYRQNEYFNVDIGSYRTAIGYYNTLLRGSWLQTALTRPKLFTFEDDGGFLPLHNVGVSVNGRIPSGNLGLHYVVEAGSSRNYAQPGRTLLDLEDNGAWNIAVFSRPRNIQGLQFGFSRYRDRFSPAPGFDMSRIVWTAHAVYQGHRFEFLNEGVFAKFSKPGYGYGSTPGFYSQLAYRTGAAWTPYLRLDYVNVYGPGIVGLNAALYTQWRKAITGGIRYDLSESVALKFEAGRNTDRLGVAFIQAAIQMAFTF